MKKILLMVVAAMMATMSVNAQNGYDDTKHEVAISYGIYSNSQIIDVYEEMGSAIVGSRFDNEKFLGPIGVEYFYHVKPWLGVGGVFTYGQNKQDVFSSKDKVGVSKNSYITVMPAVKFDWLRKNNFGMYSKLAVGATFRSEKFDSQDPLFNNYDDNNVHFNWQASLIGIEAGSPTLRGFVELGVGEQGIILAGVRCKF
ncbi:MAG: hypothetical protein J5510_06915 [Prevotella sp.]|nr:hypothetical protein [Prevotella sp.]